MRIFRIIAALLLAVFVAGSASAKVLWVEVDPNITDKSLNVQAIADQTCIVYNLSVTGDVQNAEAIFYVRDADLNLYGMRVNLPSATSDCVDLSKLSFLSSTRSQLDPTRTFTLWEEYGVKQKITKIGVIIRWYEKKPNVSVTFGVISTVTPKA